MATRRAHPVSSHTLMRPFFVMYNRCGLALPTAKPVVGTCRMLPRTTAPSARYVSISSRRSTRRSELCLTTCSTKYGDMVIVQSVTASRRYIDAGSPATDEGPTRYQVSNALSAPSSVKRVYKRMLSSTKSNPLRFPITFDTGIPTTQDRFVFAVFVESLVQQKADNTVATQLTPLSRSPR